MKKLFLAIVLSATAFGMLNSCEIANDQHYHTYSKEWSYDETNHWREATCEHNDITVNLGEHSWDSGTLTKKPTEEEYGIKTFTCKVCKLTKTERVDKLVHTHTFHNYYINDDEYHWRPASCSHTDLVTGKVKHTYLGNHCPACDHYKESEGLLFDLLPDGTYEVIGTKVENGVVSIDANMIIPATYNGVPVTSIADNAFAGSQYVDKVTIPSSITHIGDSAFRNCIYFKSITIPEDSNLTTIGDYAFSGDVLLTSFYIPEKVNNIGESILSGCKNIEKITVADGNENYLVDNNGLFNTTYTELISFTPKSSTTEFVIPKSISKIHAGAFYFSLNLQKLSFEEGSKITQILDTTFKFCSGLKDEIILPSGITSIGNEAFFSCTRLEGIILPEGLTKIGKNAFDSCQSVVNFTLPQTLKTIGDEAFRSCFAVSTITIPVSVTSIGRLAFIGCTSLSEIHIPKNVYTIGFNPFYGCKSLKSITVDDRNTRYKSVDGNLYTKNGKTLISYALGNDSSSFILPNDVEEIGFGAFYSAQKIENITFNTGLKKISDEAFLRCTNLKSISNLEGIESIGVKAFAECSNLGIGMNGHLALPQSLKTIAERAFFSCSSLNSVFISAGVTSIDEAAFGATGIISVEFEKTDLWKYCEYNYNNELVAYHFFKDENIDLSDKTVAAQYLCKVSVTTYTDWRYGS